MSVKSNIQLDFIGRHSDDQGVNKQITDDITDSRVDKADVSKIESQQLTYNTVDNHQNCYSFEEAIKATGHGKFHYYVFVASGLSLVALIAELIGLGNSVPSAKCDMKFTTTQQGLLNSIAFLGFICSSHMWGFLADTWGRRKALRLSLLSTFIVSVLSSISVSISMLIATRFFVGFCVAGIQSSALPYLGEFHSDQTRARAITFASMCMTFSVLLVSIISFIIIPMKWSISFGFLLFTPWRFSIICNGLFSLAAFLVLGFLPESPKFLLSLGKEKDALEILKRIHASNIGNKKSTSSKVAIGINLADTNLRDVAALIWKQTWPLFRAPHLRNMLLLSYLSFVLYGIAHGMTLWLPHIYNVLVNYIDESKTLCEVLSAALSESNQSNSSSITPNECANITNPSTFRMMLIFGSYLMLVYVAVGFCIKWVSIKKMTVVGLLADCISGLILIWSANFYATYFFLCILVSCGNFASLLGGLSQDLFPTNLKSMAVCFIFMFGRIGGVAGSNLIGLLISSNCNVIFITFGAVLLSCVILSILFMKAKSST